MLIPLINSLLQAIVDEENYERLVKSSWREFKGRNTIYAVNGSGTLMHRLVANAGDGQIVDHIDRNGLNNVMSNLRWVTHSQSNMNRAKVAKTSSPFKGVSFNKAKNRFMVQISKDRKRYFVGLFSDEVEAAVAYDNAATRLFGEFAFLNFPVNVSNNGTKRVEAEAV